MWRAGEFEGSGKVFIHCSMECLLRMSNSTGEKRWLCARGTHDLATTQQALSAVESSCRWSTMWSRSSGEREHDIGVHNQR